MCIAIYSPIGTETPKESYLRTSFTNNPDGAGFAFNTDDGRVKILKGFMTWESFIETYNKYKIQYDFKNRGVLIHFRITTHGGTVPECTHPFPISSDAGTLQKLSQTSEYAVIHNGIILLTGTEAHKLNHMSDTMVYISKYLSKMATYPDWFSNPVTFELIYDMIDSKMAILRGDGTIKATYGFTEDVEDHNFYSNNTYKETRVKYTYPAVANSQHGYPYYGGYDYDDDDYYYRGWYKDYCDKSSQTTDDKNKSKSKTTTYTPIELAKLEPGDIIDCGSWAYTVTDEEVYFRDRNGSIYMMELKDFQELKGAYIKSGLMVFDDHATVTDAEGKPKYFPASGTYWACEKTIIW